MIITVLGFKGGVAKTTTALHLAAYLQQYEPTLLVDGDPNRSASAWASRGKIPCDLCDEKAAIKQAPKYRHIVIDTKARPNEEDLEHLVEGCDLLILPTTPDALALDAMLLMVKSLPKGTNYKILLTIVPPKPSRAGEEALALFQEENLPHYPFVIRRFSAYQRAALSGCAVFDSKDRSSKTAWGDYQKLGREIVKG
ncbi:chromosome partitioning protein, ParA family (plasmid) [Calothrix sp. NIES-4071]|nr:chromosome partitioning protein, ParA family [Calothrix sp. NIES-4071]BAZ65073.1 chromosome partitioning protein, ParA family [Calothrix sp. NIES-4105]